MSGLQNDCDELNLHAVGQRGNNTAVNSFLTLTLKLFHSIKVTYIHLIKMRVL